MRAARLWGAAEALLEAIEVTAYPHAPDRPLHRHEVDSACARLDDEQAWTRAWTRAWTEGREMTAWQAAPEAGLPG